METTRRRRRSRVGWLTGKKVVLGNDPRPSKGPHIFKLHGSCNWRHVSPGYGDSTATTPPVRIENDEVEIANQPDFAATCDATELAIAAPGPGKQYQTARFQKLWDSAGEALKAAGAVVILGYRMPPTDARSRRFLLENLPQGEYPIHIVLGHDTNSPDARRIEGVLRMARPNANISVRPMFAQDYIDAWDPKAPRPGSRGVVQVVAFDAQGRPRPGKILVLLARRTSASGSRAIRLRIVERLPLTDAWMLEREATDGSQVQRQEGDRR